MLSKRWLILLLPFLLLLMAARQLPLIDPEPIPVPAGMSAEDTAREIKRSFIGRGWEISDEKPGSLNATRHLRSHVATVGVRYDDSAVHIAYRASENLKYQMKRSGPSIHKNYLSWVDNVVTDMKRNLQLAALDE